MAGQVALALIDLPGNRLREDVLGPVSQDALEPLAEMDAGAEPVTPNLGFGGEAGTGGESEGGRFAASANKCTITTQSHANAALPESSLATNTSSILATWANED